MILLGNDMFSLFASRAKTLVGKAAVRSLDASGQTVLSSGGKIPMRTAVRAERAVATAGPGALARQV